MEEKFIMAPVKHKTASARVLRARIGNAKAAKNRKVRVGLRLSKGTPTVKRRGNDKFLGLVREIGGAKARVMEVRNSLGLSQGEFARVTGYSVRSVAGWESGQQLSASARQKLAETYRLRAALAEIIPPKELREWMRTPNPAFEGQTPIQVIERGETDRVWRMIHQIDANVAS